MSIGVNSSSPTRGAIDSRRDLVMDQIFFPPLSDNFFAGVIACILIPLFASTIEFQEVILSPIV